MGERKRSDYSRTRMSGRPLLPLTPRNLVQRSKLHLWYSQPIPPLPPLVRARLHEHFHLIHCTPHTAGRHRRHVDLQCNLTSLSTVMTRTLVQILEAQVRFYRFVDQVLKKNSLNDDTSLSENLSAHLSAKYSCLPAVFRIQDHA